MDVAEDDLYKTAISRGVTEKQAAEIMYNTLQSITYIHAQGIIHRDIKPENILVGPQMTDVLLADFGLAIEARTAKKR